MVKALARAFRWKRLLDSGRYASISEIAAVENIDRGYVGSILRLTLLAPTIVEVIIDGSHPTELELSRLLKPFPLTWSDQCAALLAQPRPPVEGRSNRHRDAPHGPIHSLCHKETYAFDIANNTD
jgi:hypothetical protein